MKRTESLYRTAALLLLLMLAAACTRDDTFDDAAPGNAADPAAALTITVTDGTYAPETSAANAATDDGAPVTRSVENGYATRFTKGDQIGLYVAEATLGNNGSPDQFSRMLHENLCLTYNGKSWKLPSDTKLKYDPTAGHGILYFAYYPYQADMNDKKPDGNNASGNVATEAPDFFHTLISKWEPRDDQSTYATYTASDLMVARGTVANRTDGFPGSLLNFKMQHQMLLNIVRLPHITSTYTEKINGSQQTKSYYLYTGVARVPNFWMENPHTARLITNPSGEAKNITDCSYYDLKFVKHEFDIEIPDADDLRGKYKTYTVDNATETKSDRAPQEGDFYMKDGTVLPQETFKDSNMPQNVKDDCIGVIFWVGEKDGTHWTQTEHMEGDHLMMDEHPACTHGMVVALTDAASDVVWATKPEDGNTLWEWAYDFAQGFTDNENSLWKMVFASDSYYGYAYSVLFGLYTAHNEGADFPAFKAVKNYADSHSTPEGCSGWFFPNRRELATMWFDAPVNYPEHNTELIMFNKINPQIEKANGAKLEGLYWSSSDYKTETAWTVNSEYPGFGSIYNLKSQTEACKVRAVLAF